MTDTVLRDTRRSSSARARSRRSNVRAASASGAFSRASRVEIRNELAACTRQGVATAALGSGILKPREAGRALPTQESASIDPPVARSAGPVFAAPAGAAALVGQADTGDGCVEPGTSLSARPWWQTVPCPSWCMVGHADDDCLADRYHLLDLGEQDNYGFNLSLHEYGWRPASAGGHPAEFFPLAVEVNALQHVGGAEPFVELTMSEGIERALKFSIPEACRLIGLFARAVDGVTQSARVPVDCRLGVSDGHARRSPELVTELSLPCYASAAITSNLLQWTEPGSDPQLEVEIDVAGNPDSYTPEQARTLAARLRDAAAHIDALADGAAAANAAALAQQDSRALESAGVRASTDAGPAV